MVTMQLSTKQSNNRSYGQSLVVGASWNQSKYYVYYNHYMY